MENVLSSRNLLSRKVMRRVLCTLNQTRSSSNNSDLGKIGNVVFREHKQFSVDFESGGDLHLRKTNDLAQGLTGPVFWSTGASECQFKHIRSMGDVHGDLLSLLSGLYIANVINEDGEWVAENTVFIQLGDLLDRNRPGLSNVVHSSKNIREEIDILQYLYFLDYDARNHNSRVISVTGNHDFWPYEGSSAKSRKGYVGNPLKLFGGSMTRRDEYFKSTGMRTYMAYYRPPIFKVNNWLAMHGGIEPTNLKKHMRKIRNDVHPVKWVSDKWIYSITHPHKNFSAFIIDAMYNRYWATVHHDPNRNTSVEFMELLSYFKIDGDGGLLLGHTPMWIDDQNDSESGFHSVEVTSNAECTTDSCGVVLADVASSEGFHQITRRTLHNSDRKKKDIKTTATVWVDRRSNTLYRVCTGYNSIRVYEQFINNQWVIVKKENPTEIASLSMRSNDTNCVECLV